MKRRRCTFCRLFGALLASFLAAAPVEAQDQSGAGDTPSSPEEPLPLRVPESAPPSPEVPLPNTSPLIQSGRIDWSGDIDPDLSWIGAPWDHLPPIDEGAQDAGISTAPSEAVPSEATAAEATAPGGTPAPGPSPQSPPPVTRPPPGPTPRPSSQPSPEPPPPTSDQPPLATTEPSVSGSPFIAETVASVGEVTEVPLPGTGWIYVGAIPRDADIDLIESRSGAGETLFRFRPRENGEIVLSFQRQDMVTGSFEESTRLLSVLEAGASLPETVAMPDRGAMEDQQAPEEHRPPPPSKELQVTTDGDGDYQEARRLLAEGRREDALESFLQHYDGGGTPELHQEIASLAADTGYPEIASHFWQLNLRLPSEEGSAARRGLAERWVTTVPIEDLEEFFRLARTYNDMPSAGQLFGWARLYDADGPTPDVRRALLLYSTLTQWYPGSTEAPEAERRLRFLRRHFLEIR